MTMKPHPALLPFSWIYGTGVLTRNLLFETGLLPVVTLPIPVISVGNISSGGTGKTPLVEFLAEDLVRRGRKPGILSRGYGRATTGYQVVSNGSQRCAEAISAGDEPALLASRISGVPIAVDEDRVHGATKLLESFGIDSLLLDDGFQHRHLGRASDIVLLTAGELLRGSNLLPAGYRREPWTALRRASLVVISKCADLKMFRSARSRLPKDAPTFAAGIRTAVSGIRRYQSEEAFEASFVHGKSAVAFSGLGDPAAFGTTLSDLNVRLLKQHRFPDHHWFSVKDIQNIIESRSRSEAEMVLTTAKDAVRLDALPPAGRDLLDDLPLFIVEMKLEVLEGIDVLAATLDAALASDRRGT